MEFACLSLSLPLAYGWLSRHTRRLYPTNPQMLVPPSLNPHTYPPQTAPWPVLGWQHPSPSLCPLPGLCLLAAGAWTRAVDMPFKTLSHSEHPGWLAPAYPRCPPSMPHWLCVICRPIDLTQVGPQSLVCTPTPPCTPHMDPPRPPPPALACLRAPRPQLRLPTSLFA